MTLDPVELLKSLCATPSLSTAERGLVELLVRVCTAIGMSAWIDEAGNFIAERGSGARTLVFLGHVDTVPGEIPVRVENGCLYGRGAVDAKGPLAACVSAVSRLASLEGLRVVIVGAVEEEAASSKGAWHVRDKYRPDYTIIGEPSGVGGITLGYKGRVSLRYRVSRPMEHTAAAGKSAAAMAVDFWNAIDRHCAAINGGKRPADTIDPHLAAFNTSLDPFSDAAELIASFRLPLETKLKLGPTEDESPHVAREGGSLGPSRESPVEQLRAAAAAAAPPGDAAFSGYIAPFKADKRNALVRAFLQVIRQHDLEPTFKFKTGTSDMNIVGPAWQCPIVAYGPGDSRLDHTPHEHVRVDEYLKSIDILEQVILTLAARQT